MILILLTLFFVLPAFAEGDRKANVISQKLEGKTIKKEDNRIIKDLKKQCSCPGFANNPGIISGIMNPLQMCREKEVFKKCLNTCRPADISRLCYSGAKSGKVLTNEDYNKLMLGKKTHPLWTSQQILDEKAEKLKEPLVK